MSFRTFCFGIICVVCIAMAALAYLGAHLPRNAAHHNQAQAHEAMD
jgi:hypothetical protein